MIIGSNVFARCCANGISALAPQRNAAGDPADGMNSRTRADIAVRLALVDYKPAATGQWARSARNLFRPDPS